MSRIPGRALIVLSILLAVPALAQDKEHISSHHDWEAWAADTDKGKICYIASSPKSWKPKGINRDPAYFQVAHFPGGMRGVVHVEVGYPRKPGDKPLARIKVRNETQSFRFLGIVDKEKSGSAWVADEKHAPVVKAMQAGSTMTFTATSARGTVVTDSYSLRGFTAAYKAIGRACRS